MKKGKKMEEAKEEKVNGKAVLWNVLSETNPAHTKNFKRVGGFSGTAINPTWQLKRMTEEFGPIGFGWYYEVSNTSIHPAEEGQIIVYREVNLYVNREGEWSKPIHGCGGDFVVSKNKYGLNADDEAYKKAETDALGNAMKKLGVGADVHMGMFDDNKYVNDMRAKFGEGKPKEADEEILPLTADEYLLLQNGVQDSMNLEELKTAMDKVNSARKRMTPEQKETLTKAKDIRKLALAQSPVPMGEGNRVAA